MASADEVAAGFRTYVFTTAERALMFREQSAASALGSGSGVVEPEPEVVSGEAPATAAPGELAPLVTPHLEPPETPWGSTPPAGPKAHLPWTAATPEVILPQLTAASLPPSPASPASASYPEDYGKDAVGNDIINPWRELQEPRVPDYVVERTALP